MLLSTIYRVILVFQVKYEIFCGFFTQGETMRIVYRMRGLLGDATEDMVNTLDTGKGKNRLLVFHLYVLTDACVRYLILAHMLKVVTPSGIIVS